MLSVVMMGQCYKIKYHTLYSICVSDSIYEADKIV